MYQRHCRSGFSLIELQVAFVVLALAVAGLSPLVIMQSKHLKKMEQIYNDSTTYYMLPSRDDWARKLGAGASLRTVDPGPKPTPPMLLMDAGELGFTINGSDWSEIEDEDSFQGNHLEHDAGDGSASVHWTFSELPVGWYEVHVTWKESEELATNAQFTVNDGTTELGGTSINFQVAPAGEEHEGRLWESLGVYPITSGVATINLSDDASDKVIADGVILVPVQNHVFINAVDKSLTGESVTAHVTVTVEVPE